jgi:hypothetical protein
MKPKPSVVLLLFSVLLVSCEGAGSIFVVSEASDLGALIEGVASIMPIPVRREYALKSKFDYSTTGQRIFAVYESGYTKEIPINEVTIKPEGVDKDSVFISTGIKYVNIAYKDKTAEFTVNVIEYADDDLDDDNPAITPPDGSTSIGIIIKWK